MHPLSLDTKGYNMAMEWSFNEAEIFDSAMDVLSTWTKEDLAEALVFSDCDDFEGNDTELERFEQERLAHYIGIPSDILEREVWERAEKTHTCSNDFSELYIDKQGYRTIILP